MDNFPEFVQWIRGNGGYVHPDLVKRTDEQGIYGIYATKEIPGNTLLSRIPIKLCITASLHDSPSNWLVRIKHMYSIIKEIRNKNSFYAPLIVTMPKLEEYKNWHPYLALSEYERDKVEAYCVIYKMMRQSTDTNCKTIRENILAFDPSVTEDEIMRAYMLVLTRSWPGLYTPYIDLFNHSVKYGVVCKISPDAQEFYSNGIQPANGQVYISYGIRDVLCLAYDYAFYDEIDFSIAVMNNINYIADNNLKFGVAKNLLDFGMNGEIDTNKNLMCTYKDLSMFSDYTKFIGLSEHGICDHTWDLFNIMAIDNLEEMVLKKGSNKYTKALLIEHIETMLSSVNQTIDVSDAELPNANPVYRSLIRASKKRISIIEDNLKWLKKE